DTATGLTELGYRLLERGNLTEARPCFEGALDYQRRALGLDHADIATGLIGLGALEAASGRIDEAAELMRQCETIHDRLIRAAFSTSSDRQRLQLLGQLRGSQGAYLSLVNRYLSRSAEEVRRAFDLVLRRKALGAEALGAQRDAILGGRYPNL